MGGIWRHVLPAANHVSMETPGHVQSFPRIMKTEAGVVPLQSQLYKGRRVGSLQGLTCGRAEVRPRCIGLFYSILLH